VVKSVFIFPKIKILRAAVTALYSFSGLSAVSFSGAPTFVFLQSDFFHVYRSRLALCCVVRARSVVDIGYGSCCPTRNLDGCAKFHVNVDACVNGKRGKDNLLAVPGGKWMSSC
jgi:hypothetical protein